MRSLHPVMRQGINALLSVANEYGVRPRITSTVRSSTAQARLYQAYIEGRSKYPAAPPGTSKHELGQAVDLAASDAELAWLGAIWESWGGRWGGRYRDPIHFEIG